MKKNNKKSVMKSQRNTKRSQREIPTGVKVVSIIYYIAAVVIILSGIIFLTGASFVSEQLQNNQVISAIGQSGLVVIGIIVIIAGIIAFLLGRYLWLGRNWARIIIIILSVLSIISAIANIVNGYPLRIINLLIHALIAGYLLFSKDVKSAFR